MRNAKKVITLLLTMVLLVSGVADVVPIHVYAQNMETMQRADGNLQAFSQKMNIEGSNSIGNMIASELTSKQEEQRENNGCNIFSAEVDKKCVTIFLETIKDGTLVAAIYEEDGIKMLASGTTTVKAGEEKAEVTVDTDSMPSYFYLRVFLVDSDTLQPLASSYESPNYTKEMQEFLSKTTEDFDKDRVYNLDKDKTTNFAVYNEDTQVIPQSSTTNQLVSVNDQKEQYVFMNADENITSLHVGDIFVYNLEEDDILIVKIGEIQKNGTTVIITGEDSSLEDVFDYVKIEGDSSTMEAEVDASTCEEGVVYNGLVEEDTAAMKSWSVPSKDKKVTEDAAQVDAVDIGGSQNLVLSYSFLEKKIAGDDTNTIKVSGGAELKIGVSSKLYISRSYQYFELKTEYSFKVNVSISGNGKGEIPLPSVVFTPVPTAVFISIAPDFCVEASAKLDISGTLKGTDGFSVSSDTGTKNLTSAPSFKSNIKIEGKIFIGLSMEPQITVFSDKVAKVGLKSKVGAEIKATYTIRESASSSKIHTCNNCLKGEVTGKFTISFEIKFLNSEKLKYKNELEKVSIKVADFYYSFDHQELAWTVCPHLKYKVDITAKDNDGNLLENAKAEAPFSIVAVDSDGNTEIKDVTAIATDKKGAATGYLSNGTYTIKVSKDGYENAEKKITIMDTGKSMEVTLKKESGNNNSSSGGNGNNSGSSGNGSGNPDNSFDNGTVISDIMADSKTVSLGRWHSGAITKDGSLYMWGGNWSGQLGDDTTTNSHTPKKILDNVAEVSLGEPHSGAITKDGSLYMWGYNGYGELGDDTTTNSHTPKKILENVAEVSLGDKHSGAITKDGSLYMWGDNWEGRLGDGTTTDSYKPKKILENVAEVSLGDCHSGAITKDGSLYMWGDNSNGQLGDGTITDSHIPKKILDNVAAVSLGLLHSGAIMKDGSLYMWGYNGHGQLGDGTTTSRYIPVKVMENVAEVSLGYQHSGAITKDGSLYMWGYNGYGELGDGTTTDSSTPKKILENMAEVSLGYCHSGAITKDGSLYMWGDNSDGQLGDGTTTSRYTPVKVMDNLLLPTTGQSLNTFAIRNAKTRLSSQSDRQLLYKTDTIQLSAAPDFKVYGTMKKQEAATGKATRTFTNLQPNKKYTFYAMKSKEGEELLTFMNLLYINQGISDEKGNITFTCQMREECDEPIFFVVGEDGDTVNTGKGDVEDIPSPTPTLLPTNTPTDTPVTITASPTVEVTETPMIEPATEPTRKPTVTSTVKPMVTPTVKPMVTLTIKPTVTPTVKPTVSPTKKPTIAPTIIPITEPTVSPTIKPTVLPSPTPIPVKKGTILNVTSKKCKVKVLSASAKNPTVAYQGTTNKKAKSITIPTTVTVKGVTYKVTAIADSAFAGNKKIKKVTIGKNITTIGKKAFQGCSTLKSIIIKTSSLKTVGKNALKGTNKKLVVKVPKKKLKNYKKYFKGKGNKKVKVKK